MVAASLIPGRNDGAVGASRGRALVGRRGGTPRAVACAPVAMRCARRRRAAPALVGRGRHERDVATVGAERAATAPMVAPSSTRRRRRRRSRARSSARAVARRRDRAVQIAGDEVRLVRVERDAAPSALRAGRKLRQASAEACGHVRPTSSAEMSARRRRRSRDHDDDGREGRARRRARSRTLVGDESTVAAHARKAARAGGRVDGHGRARLPIRAYTRCPDAPRPSAKGRRRSHRRRWSAGTNDPLPPPLAVWTDVAVRSCLRAAGSPNTATCGLVPTAPWSRCR